MEQWSDDAIVIAARSHGESGAVVTLLTCDHGKHAGYVHGGQSLKKRPYMQIGTRVKAQWISRTAEDLGRYQLDPTGSTSPDIMADGLKLGALSAACSLCESALPEREVHSGLFHGLQTLIETLESDVWGVSYIVWEVALLKELGYGLNLAVCAGGGDAETLSYVSPKSGRAVSEAAAQPYKEKLLLLPAFLTPHKSGADEREIMTGLEMTGYFLEHWVYAHHSKGVPEARLRFQDRYAKQLQSECDQTAIQGCA